MRVEYKDEKQFEPIEVKITFQSEEELSAFSTLVSWAPTAAWLEERGVDPTSLDRLQELSLDHNCNMLQDDVIDWLIKGRHRY